MVYNKEINLNLTSNSLSIQSQSQSPPSSSPSPFNSIHHLTCGQKIRAERNFIVLEIRL